MRITFPQPEGTLSDVTRLAPRSFHVRPLLAHSGSQWFHWCGCVDDLHAGEQATVTLEWPAVPRAEDFPGATEEFILRHAQQGSFVEALPQVMGTSEDLETWDFPPVSIYGNQARVELIGTGRPFYLTTQFPYTPRHLSRLHSFVGMHAPGALQEIGRSRAGLPIHAVLLDSPAGRSVPTIYIQAYQHLTEFSGPWVVDRMLRHLLSDAGHALRERFSFHLVPVVEIDSFTYGLSWATALQRSDWPDGRPHVARQNINRDWEAMELEPTRAIDSFLQVQMDRGHRYLVGFDLHNGWIRADDSGASYTAFADQTGTPQQRAEQRQFIDHLYSGTDHEPPGRYWIHEAPGTFAQYFFRRTGAHLSHTVEFSRSMWWNRTTGQYDPYRPEHHARYAREVLAALGTWPFVPLA